MKLSPTTSSRVVHHRDQTWLVGGDGQVHKLAGDSAGLLRAVLDFVTVPRDYHELLAHLEQLSGAPLPATTAIDELLDLLCAARVLSRDAPVPAQPAPALRPRRLLLGLSGAVAAVHAPALVQLLQQAGFEVRVAMTRAARRFVSPLGLEALTHAAVPTDLWRQARGGAVPHINLAEWAEVMLICPASATTIARLASGDCSDVVAAAAIATRARVIVVPSMNPAMLSAKAVVRNLAQLREDGFYVVQSGYGFEVADAPLQRVAVRGAAPRLDAVVALVQLVAGPPATDWEHIYATTPLEALPWFSAAIEPEVEAALSRHVPSPTSVIDIGTGPGTFAIEMARRGHRVLALDISAAAIQAARARAPAADVTWRVGDLLTADIEGRFMLAHDRGCLHTLARESLPAYRDRVARLLSPGGLLFLMTFAAGKPHPPGKLAFTGAEIAGLFAPRFTVVDSRVGRFHGEPSHPALFTVLSRTDR